MCIPYKEGRLLIGNPPFDRKILLPFLQKSAEIADYIAYILPGSYYEENAIKGFQLIYSESLGYNISYSGRTGFNTCFNIYVRSEHENAEIQNPVEPNVFITANRPSTKYYIKIKGVASNFGERLNQDQDYCMVYYVSTISQELRNRLYRLLNSPDLKKYVLNHSATTNSRFPRRKLKRFIEQIDGSFNVSID